MRLSWTQRTGLRLAASAASHRKLSILIYHRVLPELDPILQGDPDVQAFRANMDVVSKVFNVLPLSEAIRALRHGNLPPRAACITFDDGYADNVDHALPILQEYGLPATFFIASGLVGGGMMFSDRIAESVRNLPQGTVNLSFTGLGQHEIQSTGDRRWLIAAIVEAVKHLEGTARMECIEALEAQSPTALPRDLMMTQDQVRRLVESGMEVGGHTRTHPILTRIPDSEARAEIGEGREELESIVGEPVRLFAYPNGKPDQDYAQRHTHMARECGFEAAVSTAWGVSRPGRDPFQLARFTPWDATSFRFGARLIWNLSQTNPPLAMS